MTALGGGYERKPGERKRLIVNEQGEFVRPSDLQKTMGGPLFSPYSEEEEQEFLFDDDLDCARRSTRCRCSERREAVRRFRKMGRSGGRCRHGRTKRAERNGDAAEKIARGRAFSMCFGSPCAFWACACWA